MISAASLSKLRILITNDDGIDSSGIKVLERIANSLTPDVWTIAPMVQQSGKGFCITFDDVLRVHELSPRRFSVSGTPADCVFLALNEILKDHKPDLILSGINVGANIADFIGFSGTVGATFAGASQNIKSIAVSQDCRKECPSKFPVVEHYLPKIIKKLLSFQWPEKTCMNLNFPEAAVGEVAGVKVARQGDMDVTWHVYKRSDPVDRPYYWLQSTYKDGSKFDNSDIMLLEQKKMITITPLQCKHEFSECMKELGELFLTNV